jgi:hypothetical protein
MIVMDIQSISTRIITDKVQNSLNEGIDYLIRTSQNGVWGWWCALDPHQYKNNIKKIWSTAATIKALIRAGMDPNHPLIKNGVAWLLDNKVIATAASGTRGPAWARMPMIYKEEIDQHFFIPNTHETSCVLLALLENEDIISPENTIIIDAVRTLVRFNHRGYWPTYLTKPAERPHDSRHKDLEATCLALTLLGRVHEKGFDIDNVDRKIDQTCKWVKNRQNKCGSWGELEDSSGTTTTTCGAIKALVENDPEQYQNHIQNGVQWLLNNQDLIENGHDGRWRTTKNDTVIASTIENTALAITALLRYGQSYTSVPVQMGIQWLLQHKELGDGWREDTLRVVNALSEYLKQLPSSA